MSAWQVLGAGILVALTGGAFAVTAYDFGWRGAFSMWAWAIFIVGLVYLGLRLLAGTLP